MIQCSIVPVLIVLFGILSVGTNAEPVASFPLQFVATVTVTAHLVEEESVYPPRVRRMTILYDYIGKIRSYLITAYDIANLF